MTSIGDNWFYKCLSLTNVQLPSSLKSIGDNAFSGTGLKEVEVPKNYKNGEWAFVITANS